MPGSNSRPNVSEGYEVPTELPGSTGLYSSNIGTFIIIHIDDAGVPEKKRQRLQDEPDPLDGHLHGDLCKCARKKVGFSPILLYC